MLKAARAASVDIQMAFARVVLVVLAVTLAAVRLVPPSGAAAAAPFPVIGQPAPDFALIDQSGRRISLAQFRGRLILLNFIYTHCTDVCPLTTGALARVQRELIGRGWWITDVVFLSVTTDPVKDTPAVLHAYAQRYKADLFGWHFLTGDPKAVAAVYGRYGIRAQPLGSGLQDHDVPTFVVDRAGIVLGAYGANPTPADVLHDLAQLR